MTDFQPLNLAQLYAGADSAVSSAMQANLMTLQASRMKQEFDTEDKLRDLARNSTKYDEAGNPSFDLQSFTKGAYAVDPMKAIQFEKSATEAKKTALEMENTQSQIDERRFKQAGDRLKLMNEASTVPYLKYKELVDKGMPDAEARQQVQPLHQAAIQNLVGSNMFTKDQLAKFTLSPQFDPTTAEAGMRQVLGAKESLAQYWEEKKFGQAERFHSDQMKIDIRGQNITVRGQNLTDARAKESLAQQGLEVKQNDDGTFNIIDKKEGTASVVVDANGKPVAGNKNLSESQGKAVGFGQRAVEAHNILNDLEDSGTTGKLAQAKQGLGNTPLVGGALEAGANKLLSSDQQRAEQAQRDFINAVLRPESGATISPQEFENARKQYFAQPGDSDAVIKQKRENREREIGAIRAMAGPGSKQIPEIRKQGTAPSDKITPMKVTSSADYAKVPAGAQYLDPNGVLRVKGETGE